MAPDGKVTLDTGLDNSGIKKDAAKMGTTIKSEVAKIAAEYRKQGMSMSDAMKKAWSEVEHSSSKSSRKVSLDIRGNIGSSLSEVVGRFGGLKSVIGTLATSIAVVFGARQIISFMVDSSKAAMSLSDALTGLRSILEGQGRSFSKAQSFIEEYTSDGLIPAKNAITAYKNLASRGYDDSQIQQVLTALKDASAYGRQASYTMGEAVESATEGLKNENSILVDNAGVTKNVAKMWEEYAASIGTTANNLTQQQKNQAEVLGILEATKYQTGDATTVAATLSGQLLQLAYRFNDLRIAVGNALNPIVQSFLPIINTAISTLVRFANAVAAVISLIFGKASVSTGNLAESNDSVASSASAGAAAEKELADATSAAGKAAKKSLAGFDELNKLQGDTGGGGSSGAVGGGAGGEGIPIEAESEIKDTVSPKFQAIADKIQSLLAPLREIDFGPAIDAFGRLGEAAGRLGETIGKGLEWAWNNILVPLAEWTIEEIVPAVVGLLADALEAIDAVLQELAPVAEEFWINFLQPLANWTADAIVDAINGVSDAFNWLFNLLSENKDSIATFATVLGSLAASVGIIAAFAGIAAAIKDVMLLSQGAQIVMSPLTATIMGWAGQIKMLFMSAAGWITGTMVPSITTALGGVASALGISVGWVVVIVAAVAAAIAAIVIYWDEIVAATGAAWEAVKGIWGVVTEFFTDLWESIAASASEAWEAVKEFFSPAIKWFSELLDSIGQTFEDIFYNIGVIASGCWEVIKAVWAVVSTWFDDNVISPIAEFFSNIWENVKEGAADAWEGIKDAFSSVAKFFGDIFSEAWEKVCEVFSPFGEIFADIKDGILTAFKEIVNGLIRGLNSAIADPFNGINWALSKIRNASILGLTPFSGLRDISVPQIPQLAQGAVLPANKPFLAMVGDQKHGTNVEAPLSTIQEAVAIVMEDMLQGQMAGFEAVVEVLREILEAIYGIEIGDEVISKAARRYQEKLAVAKGR